MDVVIAGGHGQIALRLERLLSARGDQVRGLVRNRDHFDDLSEAGRHAHLASLQRLGDQSQVPTRIDAIGAIFGDWDAGTITP